MTADISHITWVPIAVNGLSSQENEHVHTRIREVLESWRGTRYCPGQQQKGVAVDCVRFATGVVDELYGGERAPIETLPPDAALHSKRSAVAAMRRIRRLYEPLTRVVHGQLQPMDLVVTGERSGGPGHLLMVGWRPRTMWETGRQAVQQIGWEIGRSEGSRPVFRVYRLGFRFLWANVEKGRRAWA